MNLEKKVQLVCITGACVFALAAALTLNMWAAIVSFTFAVYTGYLIVTEGNDDY